MRQSHSSQSQSQYCLQYYVKVRHQFLLMQEEAGFKAMRINIALSVAFHTLKARDDNTCLFAVIFLLLVVVGMTISGPTLRVADSIPVGGFAHTPCAACFSPSTFTKHPVDLEALTVRCEKGGHVVNLIDGTAVEGGLGQISAKVWGVEGDGVYLEVPEALSDWAEWTLVDRSNVAKDVDSFVFGVPKGIRREDLLYGEGIVHVSSKIVVDDGASSCVRDYTPTRILPDHRVEIIVKNYPVHGIMSKHYHSLK
ncbi:hypothetical protein FOZ63_001557, partial [Perkinsus olseni]